MKKVAIGCGIVLILLAIVFAGGAWYVAHKVKATISEFAEFGKIPDIERGITNKASFAAPESGDLTAEQLDRYLKVQDKVRTTLGEQYTKLDAQYKELADRLNKNQGTALDMPAVINAYKDLAGLYVQGKREQVAALNAQNMSLSEFQWVQSTAYAAAGLPVMSLDVSKMIEDAKSGQSANPGSMTVPGGPTGSDKNKALVEPHRKALEDNTGLAFFGL